MDETRERKPEKVKVEELGFEVVKVKNDEEEIIDPVAVDDPDDFLWGLEAEWRGVADIEFEYLMSCRFHSLRLI